MVDELVADKVFSVEGIFETAARFFGPVVENNTTQILDASADVNYFEITPLNDEIQ